MRILLILTIISLLSIQVTGQDLSTSIFKEGSVIPPSPNATAFNKFIDVPVGHYTGIPNVSVPVYTIQLPQMSLPISLNYHAGGLKVGEHSSWIGAGWSLNAGGSVNRTVRGLPDEWIGSPMVYKDHSDGGQAYSDNRRGFMRLNSTYFDNSLYGVDVGTFEECPEPEGTSSSRIPRGPITDTDHFADGIYDTEPDLWHFGFPGGSGKFVFNRNQELVKFQEDDISFSEDAYGTKTVSSSGDWLFDNSYFKIKDNRGIVYTFSATEQLITGTECGEVRANYNDVNITTISSWHLTRMEIGGNWIAFEYDDESITYQQTYSKSKRFTLSGPGGNPITSLCISTRLVAGKRLKKITASNGIEVAFVADTNDRLDLAGSKRLTSIKVSSQNEQILQYNLAHSYFNTDTKLRLDSVYQVDNLNANLQIPAYQFDYHSYVPELDSYKQDYWGFFNDASGNANDMVPEWRTAEYHVNLHSAVSREPNLVATQGGTMNKITYPTGGYAEFTYELNDYYSPGDTAVVRQTLTTPPSTGNAVVPFTVSNATTVSFVRNTALVQEDDDPVSAEDIGIDQYVNLQHCTGPGYTNCQTVTLSKTNGNRWHLPAGDYQLYAETRTGADPNVSHTLTIIYEQDVDYAAKKAGGLRISRIKTYDNLTNKMIEKAYQYQDDGHSSGMIFTLPYVLGSVSTYIAGQIYGVNTLPYCAETHVTPSTSVSLSASPSIPTGTYQGSHIGYSKVQEFYVDSTAAASGLLAGSDMPLGMTEYLFENHEPASYNVDPYVPAEDLSYINGKPSGQRVYKYIGASPGLNGKGGTGLYDDLIKISESNMVYQTGEDNTLKAKGLMFKRFVTQFCYDCKDALELDGVFGWQYYEMNPKWSHLVSQSSTVYDENGENPLTTYSEFEYDFTKGHHEYVKLITTDSYGDTLTAEIERAGIPTLIAGREIFRDQVQVSGEKITYLQNLPTNYMIWNAELHNLQSGNKVNQGYELVKSFDYSNNGLLEGVTERPQLPSAVSTTYLWSYDSTRMVAAIPNITRSDLEALFPAGNNYLSLLLTSVNTEDIRNYLLTDIKPLLGVLQPMTVYLYNEYGVSEIVDPNGKKTTYEYDDFGRLIRIRDDADFVLQQNEYNYNNQ